MLPPANCKYRKLPCLACQIVMHSFAMKEYWPAMESYNKAIALNERKGAYTTFQKAMSYGFVDRNLKKIETLLTLQNQYPKDQLLDDALYELATAYSREGSFEKAITASTDMGVVEVLLRTPSRRR